VNEALFWYIVYLLLSLLLGFLAGVAGKRLGKNLSRKKAVAATATLFLCLASVLPVNLALAEEAEERGNVRLPIYELYAPARVVVSFAYTKNVTIHVSTLKTSLYKAVTSPVQLEFFSEDFDMYSVTMEILYGVKVSQTIVIGLFEKGRPAKSIEFDVSSSAITITMRVSVVEAPRYPTAEEISNLVWEKWRNELYLFESRQHDLIVKMSDTVTTVGSLALIAFAVCIALIIVVFRMHQRVAELSEWGIRHKTEHRKEGG